MSPLCPTDAISSAGSPLGVGLKEERAEHDSTTSRPGRWGCIGLVPSASQKGRWLRLDAEPACVVQGDVLLLFGQFGLDSACSHRDQLQFSNHGPASPFLLPGC